MDKELPNRKSIRLKNFDYNSSGAYFLTICTENRRNILSHIVGTGVPDCPQNNVLYSLKRVELLPHGKIADKYIKRLDEFYNHLSVEKYVIMPNHIHLLILVKENKNTSENGQSRTPVPTNIERSNNSCSQFVSTFKRFCNKEFGENIWQARFNDHIIRNQRDYDEHVKYIHDNPARWFFDELYKE